MASFKYPKSANLGPIKAVWAILCLSVTASHARPVKWWSPEELAERAEVIVVGHAIDIKPIARKGSIQLGGKNPAVPVQFYMATVRVKATIKGEPTDKLIDVEFSQTDFAKGAVIVNGPGRFALNKQNVYVLYLNKGRGDYYVGALSGEYDDRGHLSCRRAEKREVTCR